MVRRFLIAAVVSALFVPALVQAQRSGTELSIFGGYNTGGGIDLPDNADLNKLDTAGSFSTGLGVAYLPRPNFAFELFWGWRPTDIKGRFMGSERTFVSLNEHDFHGNFIFMPAYSRSNFTPFLLLGLGATLLSPGEIQLDGGGTVQPDDTVKFSWAIGGGVKTYFNNDRFGLRGQIRFHSTFTSDESGGVWCDPYFGCYETIDSNWLDEWDFQGALVYRLGGGRR